MEAKRAGGSWLMRVQRESAPASLRPPSWVRSVRSATSLLPPTPSGRERVLSSEQGTGRGGRGGNRWADALLWQTDPLVHQLSHLPSCPPIPSRLHVALSLARPVLAVLCRRAACLVHLLFCAEGTARAWAPVQGPRDWYRATQDLAVSLAGGVDLWVCALRYGPIVGPRPLRPHVVSFGDHFAEAP